MKQFVTSLLLMNLIAFGCGYFSRPKLPSFDIVLVDSLSIFNTSEIKNGTPVVLFYFSSECDHCLLQTDTLLRNMSYLKKVDFLFLSNDSLKQVTEFSKKFNLKKYENVKIGLDKDGYFLKNYMPKNTPAIAIFNRNKDMKFLFDGGTDIKTLVQLLDNLK